MAHPVLTRGATAVITGGASGIGLAAAHALSALGLNVCIVDRDPDRLASARLALERSAAADTIMAVTADVAVMAELQAVERTVAERFGGTDVLMNNAGVQPGSTMFGPRAHWDQVIGINLWGIINGTQAFVPGMIGRGRPGLVVNTGSKQGITTPPGDPAYNVSKAGVKAFTEALQHELRTTPGCRIAAHLLIPGFVYTALTANGRTEKPAAAWTPEQTVAFMLDRLDQGDFYILCPDNDVGRALDEKRIRWAAGDITENRPPLSRWHPDHADAFAAFLDDR